MNWASFDLCTTGEPGGPRRRRCHRASSRFSVVSLAEMQVSTRETRQVGHQPGCLRLPRTLRSTTRAFNRPREPKSPE